MAADTGEKAAETRKLAVSGAEATGVVDELSAVQSLYQEGCLGEAEKRCDALIEAAPLNPHVRALYGDVLKARGRLAKSARAYRRAIRLDQSDSGTYLKLATALEALGKLSEAIATYKKGLTLAPGSLALLTGLAGAYLKAGKQRECEGGLKNILSEAPNQPDAHVLAGELSLARGQYAQAVQHFQYALSIDADLPSVRGRLGLSLKRCGAYPQAITVLQSAVDQDPDDVESLTELASLHADTGDMRSAERILRRAIAHKDDDASLRVSLASTLVIQGKLDEALDEYRGARVLDPGCFLAVEGEADCLYRFQLYDECYESLRKVCDANKLTAEGARVFSRVCRRLGHRDRALPALKRICARSESSNREKTVAHFALGDAYDAAHDYDAAFNSYERANKLLKSSGGIYASETAEKLTMSLIEAFSPGRWQVFPRARKRDVAPVFIMGMPRSGTSLVEQILSDYPEVHGAGELTSISEIFASLQAESDFPNNLLELDEDQINGLAEQYWLLAPPLHPDARLMTDKMPGNIFYLGLMALMFPNAKFVHCVRDPLDTCLSIYFQHFGGGYPWATSFKEIAHYYRLYRRIVKHWSESLGIPMLEVRYESITSAPEGQLRRLIEYCGIAWQQQSLEPCANLRYVPTASYDQVTRPLYTTSIGRWKNYRKHLQPLIDVLNGYADVDGPDNS